jgi:hypothetical protein
MAFKSMIVETSVSFAPKYKFCFALGTFDKSGPRIVLFSLLPGHHAKPLQGGIPTPFRFRCVPIKECLRDGAGRRNNLIDRAGNK